MKKIIFFVISILLITSLLILVYTTSFNLNAFNENFYKKEFKKYDIYSKFPGKDIESINSEILLYLKGKKEGYNTELFSQKEITHFADVKNIMQKISVFYYTSLISLILLITALYLFDRKKFLKNLSKVLFLSGLSVLIITPTLLAMITINFDRFFEVFHYTTFPQGGWLFSSSDNIIKLYPLEFFYDIAKNILKSILFYGNILIGVGILLHIKND